MKTKIFLIVLFFIIVKFLFFYPANDKVKFKLDMIEDEISKRGYNTDWIVISSKRHKWYNSILSNSAKNSHHLSGNAIDILVYDIDGDGKFNGKDIEIIKSANNYIESIFPETKGALGTYTTKGFPTNRMVHLDTRGYKKTYNY